MPRANTTDLTPAMEDYLLEIAELCATHADVTSGTLAARMGVAAPSACQMVTRLAAAGYLTHTPYRSLALTALGSEAAEHLLERRRLVEDYLVQALGFDPEAVSGESDRLEHVLSDRLRERMAARLSATLGD
jgi:DtxR family Mn-dependent transcriptional regulator